MRYCFDSSSVLEGWVRYYPPDVFPGLWDRIDALIRNGDVRSPDEVREELNKKHDEVYAWAKARNELFVPLDDEIQAATRAVLEAFPRLVGELRDRNRADPFVIALAMVNGAAVVTEEKRAGTRDRPRIPIVCDHFGIRHLRLLEMIRELGWQFKSL